MKRSILGVALTAAALGLIACGEDKGKVPEAAPAAVESAPAESSFVPGQYYASDKGFFERRAKLADAYPTLVDFGATYYFFEDSHRAYVDLYLSQASDVPVEVFAEIVDPEFRKVTDAFARKDRLAELEPKIAEYKAKIAEISPNVQVKSSAKISVSPYNIDAGTFTLSHKIDSIGSSVEWSKDRYDSGALEFGVTVASTFLDVAYGENSYALAADEAAARKLEAYLSTLRGGSASAVDMALVIKGYVLDTVAEGRDFGTIIMPEQIDIVHPETGEVFLTLSDKQLAKRFRLTSGDFSSKVGRTIVEKYDLDPSMF